MYILARDDRVRGAFLEELKVRGFLGTGSYMTAGDLGGKVLSFVINPLNPPHHFPLIRSTTGPTNTCPSLMLSCSRQPY
jgi:hypothetical protein